MATSRSTPATFQTRLWGEHSFFGAKGDPVAVKSLGKNQDTPPDFKHQYLNDLQHLQPCDLPIPIQVIHLKGPVEFLLKGAPGGDRQGTDELPEVDGAITILVEGAESVLGKLGGISVGEELQGREKRY